MHWVKEFNENGGELMALTRWQSKKEWDPFSDLWDLQHEISRFLDLPVRRSAGQLMGDGGWLPPVDILMDKDNVLVKAEIPGMTKDNLDISISGDVLTIKGEKHQEKESKERNVFRTERTYGAFQRSFVLPTSVNPDRVSAQYTNGILEITLPKKEDEKSKQIQIVVK